MRFCDNSLLLLKTHFQVFSFGKQKGTRVFQWQKDINVAVIIAPSSTKQFQFFEILIFSQDIWRNFHYVREINLISEGTLIKAFYLRRKTNQKKSETRFCGRMTAEDNNSKINVSPNMPFIFLLFKASAYLQIFLPRKSKFWECQLFSIVNVWHSFIY